MTKKIAISLCVGLLFVAWSLTTQAQLAPIQLTNPSVDAVNNDQTAAWVADESMGVLYCELVRETPASTKRVACYDSYGEVTPGRSDARSN